MLVAITWPMSMDKEKESKSCPLQDREEQTSIQSGYRDNKQHSSGSKKSVCTFVPFESRSVPPPHRRGGGLLVLYLRNQRCLLIRSIYKRKSSLYIYIYLFFYNPLLPQTTSDKENVEVAVEAAQAILIESVIVIPIFPTIQKLTI